MSGSRKNTRSKSKAVLVLCSMLAASGCRFSATASGNVNSAGEQTGFADASFDAEAASEASPPAPAPAIVLKEGKLDYKGVINFEYDKAALKNDSQTTQTLSDFETFLKKHSDVSIEIEGHTDSRGADDYNRDLSDRRAASVRAWLIEQGISEDRVTAVGKGEDEPQVPEPPQCDDKRPEDTSPCEAAWATNRRVVFEVTGGAEAIPEPPKPPPEPPPSRLEQPREPRAQAKAPQECPWLWGGHANLLGPNSWLIGAGAVQPGICWLEPSLGLGLGFGGVDAPEAPEAASGEGGHWVLNVPLRARIWFMDRHAPIADVGLGLSRYWISADLTDSAGIEGDYSRDSTDLYGHLGAGYGYRPNGSQAGFRLGLVVGALFHFTDLSDSTTTVDPGFSAAEQAELQRQLDGDSDGLSNLEPYAELSLGWLF